MKVLVIRKKHRLDYVLDISSEEKHNRAAMSILKATSRHLENARYNMQQKLPLDIEQIRALDHSKMRDEILLEYEKRERAIRNQELDIIKLNIINSVIACENFEMAKRFILDKNFFTFLKVSQEDLPCDCEHDLEPYFEDINGYEDDEEE